MKPSYYLLFFVALASLGTSSCSSHHQSAVQSPKKKTVKSDGINLDEFLVSSPVKKSEKEIIKLYMQGGRKSKNWKDYYEASGYATRARDYRSAVILLDIAIELNSKNGDLFYMRGRDKFMDFDDRNKSAKLDFIEAIRLGCTNPGAFELLANIYDSEGETEKAIVTLSKGINLCKKRKHLYLARAALYTSVGEKKKALDDYTILLNKNPDFSRGYILRGQLCEDLGLNSKALEDYEQGYKTEMKSNVSFKKEALKARAILLNKLSRFDEAISDLNLALKERPGDDELFRMRGDNHYALNDYDKALADYTSSINAAPDFARLSYEARARLYTLKGRKELAEKDLEKARALKEAPAEKPLYTGKPK